MMMQKTEATILSIENPFGDYYVIKLKPAEGLTWKAGEHAVFRLPGNEALEKESRIFSIASVQAEGVLIVGTRTGREASAFKKALLSMQPGEVVSMQGPFGHFCVRDEVSPIVLFAGGVGVTPVRALTVELANSHTRPICILFSSSDHYLFGEELAAIAEANPQMALYKTASADETQAKLAELVERYGDAAYYYFSASPRVVNSVEELVRSKGVPKARIIDDSMVGY